MLLNSPLRRYRIGIAVFILLFTFTVYELQLLPSWITHARARQSLTHHDGEPLPNPHSTVADPTHSRSSTDDVLPLPPEYQQAPDELTYCAERFGLKYLQNLSNSSIDYCDARSASSLTCFRSQTAAEGRIDSFCVGGPTAFDMEEKRFKLDCSLREWTAQEVAKGIRRLDQFPSYWYQTGPQLILNRYLRTGAAEEIQSTFANAPQDFSILVQREEKITNLWHSLMEIFSLFMTLDVLRMTRNPATNAAFFRIQDIENTQVILLDDHQEGPYFDLWTLFAEKPMIKLNDMAVDIPATLGNIIIPLPGGSNPFWQGDWEVHSCDHSELLHVFSQRVLNFYKVDDEPRAEDRLLVLTFIDRKEKRRLIDQGPYIENLKSKFPAVDIEIVDFAAFSFSEQLKIARRTDILVGVHGAGLTHGIFLPPGSTMVEIIPHGLNHKGFRNLAKVLGHHYFSSHAIERPTKVTKGGWQDDDVFLEEHRFKELVEVAVKSMYNRGLRNDDVT